MLDLSHNLGQLLSISLGECNQALQGVQMELSLRLVEQIKELGEEGSYVADWNQLICLSIQGNHGESFQGCISGQFIRKSAVKDGVDGILLAS